MCVVSVVKALIDPEYSPETIQYVRLYAAGVFKNSLTRPILSPLDLYTQRPRCHLYYRIYRKEKKRHLPFLSFPLAQS